MINQRIATIWTGPLPKQHLWISLENRPKEFFKILRVYFRKWIIHPIKRRLSKYYLIFLKNFCNLKIVAITGSAGKTTTKELLANILSLQGNTVYSFANIDPVYNIPTTILKCTPNTKYLILEMGIEYIGEMDFYTWLAKPDIAIITNISLAHAEFLKDLKTIAFEKGKIGKYAKYLLVNAEDKNIQINTQGIVIKVKPQKFDLQLLGNHLQINASLAAKAAEILGVSQEKIQTGLKQMTPTPHRLQLIKTNKFTIIDDTYNANPLATKASVETLVEYANQHKLIPVFIFAQMNELGQFEKTAHKEIADFVSRLKIKHFLTFGPANKNFGKHFENQKELISVAKKFMDKKHVILIKGSRGWKMENVVSGLISE